MGILHWYLIIYYFSVWLLVMYVSFGALGSAVGFTVFLLWAQLSVLRFSALWAPLSFLRFLVLWVLVKNWELFDVDFSC